MVHAQPILLGGRKALHEMIPLALVARAVLLAQPEKKSDEEAAGSGAGGEVESVAGEVVGGVTGEEGPGGCVKSQRCTRVGNEARTHQ